MMNDKKAKEATEEKGLAKKAKKSDKAIKETKANAAAATKKKAKMAEKAAADKLLLGMAESIPQAGGAKSFLANVAKLDKIDEQQKVLTQARKSVRADLRGDKIDLRSLDRVRKLRKMEPEDRKALKFTEALYESQLSMEITPDQKALLDDLKKKREESKEAIKNVMGGDAGKEVGSAAAPAPGGVPVKNTSISSGPARGPIPVEMPEPVKVVSAAPELPPKAGFHAGLPSNASH